MPLEIDKAITSELQRIEAERENALEVEASTQGARVEVSRTTSRWSVAAFAAWVKSKGWTAGGKGTVKF